MVGMAGAGLLLAMTAAAEPPKQQAPGSQAKPEAQAPAPQGAGSGSPEGEGKVMYTFEDDAKLKAFAELWQERQAILLRMSVLRSYWDEEQVSLNQLNSRVASEYHLDVTKNYMFDSKRRAIVEREPAAPPAPSAPATPSAQAVPAKQL